MASEETAAHGEESGTRERLMPAAHDAGHEAHSPLEQFEIHPLVTEGTEFHPVSDSI